MGHMIWSIIKLIRCFEELLTWILLLDKIWKQLLVCTLVFDKDVLSMETWNTGMSFAELNTGGNQLDLRNLYRRQLITILKMQQNMVLNVSRKGSKFGLGTTVWSIRHSIRSDWLSTKISVERLVTKAHTMSEMKIAFIWMWWNAKIHRTPTYFLFSSGFMADRANMGIILGMSGQKILINTTVDF